MDRRTFLYRGVRGGLLAILAMVAGMLVSRRQVALHRECGLDYQCGHCSKLNRCRLPEAQKARGIEETKVEDKAFEDEKG